MQLFLVNHQDDKPALLAVSAQSRQRGKSTAQHCIVAHGGDDKNSAPRLVQRERERERERELENILEI